MDEDSNNDELLRVRSGRCRSLAPSDRPLTLSLRYLPTSGYTLVTVLSLSPFLSLIAHASTWNGTQRRASQLNGLKNFVFKSWLAWPYRTS